MTLNETMNEIADAIREKTGKSELIKPVDFATEIKGITAGGCEFTPEYYLFDGDKAYNAISELLGITDGLEINRRCRGICIGTIGSTNTMAKWIYKGRLYTDYNLAENTTGIPDDDFNIRNVSAVMKIDGEFTFGELYAAFGLPSDIVTPCTKEEFEALIIK